MSFWEPLSSRIMSSNSEDIRLANFGAQDLDFSVLVKDNSKCFPNTKEHIIVENSYGKKQEVMEKDTHRGVSPSYCGGGMSFSVS
jgi:hypothetical protein